MKLESLLLKEIYLVHDVSCARNSGARAERCRLLVRARILFRDLGLDQKVPTAGSDGGTSTGEKEFR